MKEDILREYKNTSKRLLLLDYDGTLAELKPTPAEAKPTTELLQALQNLGANSSNTVVVISGRKHEEVEAWLGNLPLWLVAEHGLLIKTPGSNWSPTTPFDITWKAEARVLMEQYSKDLPGTLIEEKTAALVWHWRNAADYQKASHAAHSLYGALQAIFENSNLKIIQGKDIIEVQPLGFDKGSAAKYMLTRQDWDFILAAGDDTTDEDMFAALPDWATTIKVGEGKTLATQHISNPAEMRSLLLSLLST